MEALRRALRKVAPRLRRLRFERLSMASVARTRHLLARLFDDLARAGGVIPNQRFVVGATKVLHFLNPELFPIIDRRVALKLRDYNGALPRLATRYCGEHYLLAMLTVAKQIQAHGKARIRRLQPATPLLRIVDKILFTP